MSSQKDLEEVTFLSSLGEPRILLDSSSQGLVGGSGKRIESQIIEDFAKHNRLWLAGGVDADNVSSIRSILLVFSFVCMDSFAKSLYSHG